MITVGQLTGISHREKSDRITWRSEWMPRLEKFSEKSWRAFSSQNRTWRGVGSKEDAPKRKGFQDGADLHLDAMCRLFERERERGRQIKKHHHKEYQTWKWKGMYAWACDVQRKLHHGFNLMQSYQHISFNIEAHIYIEWNIVKMQM